MHEHSSLMKASISFGKRQKNQDILATIHATKQFINTFHLEKSNSYIRSATLILRFYMPGCLWSDCTLPSHHGLLLIAFVDS